MNTLMKSAGGITQVSADSRLLAKRIMFLEGMMRIVPENLRARFSS